MLKLAADESLDNDLLRGLLRRKPGLDIVRVQDVGLSGAPDPRILEWAAEEGRILLTQDVATMTRYAYERTTAGLRMPGIWEIPMGVSMGRVLDDILLLVECSLEGEWEGQVRYLPLNQLQVPPPSSSSGAAE